MFDQQIAEHRAINKKLDEIDTKINRELEQEKAQIEQTTTEKIEKIEEKKEAERRKNRTETQINSLKKRNDDLKKQFNLYEKSVNQLTGANKVMDTQKSTTFKVLEEYKAENKQQQKLKDNLDDDHQLHLSQLAKNEQISKETRTRIMDKQKEITHNEAMVADLQKKENTALEEIKILTNIREKMARTASQAMTQARETREELKVKELLILDLTKKLQETENRVNHFMNLHEQVKNARNKYFNLIQESSQDLAELKERIKILQNEVEILRNESSEKDRNLVDAKHQVRCEIYKRDTKRTELNKMHFQFQQKRDMINQLINEQQKLHLLLSGIQKEMNELIEKYEGACELRNYMGIQLIDRNDELCILYEKANIQENTLKEGEQKIWEKEEIIRMLNLELSEKQRQLEVVRKRIPQVPALSEKVLSLKRELDQERAKVTKLSEKVEDPDQNKDRLKDIEPDVPDQESLQAKILILEERLNNKKEQLLEKELVLEEITNLSEKLRKQALDGRKTALELSERINEFKARTTEISRKMLATVAEVSMFQATSMELEHKKEKLELMFEEAKDRFQQGIPPTEECEKEWERMEKLRIARIDHRVTGIYLYIEKYEREDGNG